VTAWQTARSCGNERLNQQAGGADHRLVLGEGLFLPNLADAALDGLCVADAVGVEEVDEGLLAGALRVFQRWPAFDEVGEDRRLLVPEPADDLREVGLQCVGEAVGDPHPVLDQGAAVLDDALEGAHVRAFAAERRDLLGVAEQSSRAISASVGSSFARLGVKA
jgi:hypothetical protein